MGSGLVVSLAGAGVTAAKAGGKAANLARLAAAGFPVPAGFVVIAGAFAGPGDDDLTEAIQAAGVKLGGGPFAVRSSAAAEDLADASYAGLYETYLDVPADDLVDAVRRCHAAAGAPRVAAYQARRNADGAAAGMAVLVQVMVPAEAAGVAFTADPVTGDRDRSVITAVRGVGERLVGGEATGDEWVVRGGDPECRRAVENAIDPAQAAAIATVARAVEAHFGAPQDIEWAYADGRLWLLQARPMTALPELVEWRAPGPGVWLRNFRLGEWLPDSMTPLFADWLLPRITAGFADGIRETAGTVLPFGHAAVNGWYYTTPQPQITPARLIRAIAESRGRLLPFVYHALIQAIRDPVAADTALLGRLYRRWRDELLPGYQRLVASAEAELHTAGPQRLIGMVDDVAYTAGIHLWHLAIVGGSAWKFEAALDRFTRRHLPGVLPEGVPVLLAGLLGTDPTPPPWAVTSIDWHHPTLAELRTTHAPPRDDGPPHRTRRLAGDRRAAEDACRAALAARPRLAARFDALLGVAQRYAAIREEQARHLTLGWPLIRHAAAGLSHTLHTRELIADPGDLFFLTRAELDTALHAGTPRLHDVLAERRSTWRRQRRLAAPLQLGNASRLVQAVMTRAGASHPEPTSAPGGTITGQAASPGRATGPARILHGPDDFHRLQPGDILIAPATTPAWTPLFHHAAAVVTDGGTLAAHASLVARGIPAVVGAGNATHQLHNGQIVTVDGATGTITPHAG